MSVPLLPPVRERGSEPAVSVAGRGLSYGELRGAAAALARELRDAERVAVWPFDPPERIDWAQAVLVEVFPRMWLQAGVRKNELPERARQIDAWKRAGVAFATKAELAAASSGDALDAAAAAIGAARSCPSLPSPAVVPEDARLREGWIAGAQVP
jgi:hypothetical protein